MLAVMSERKKPSPKSKGRGPVVFLTLDPDTETGLTSFIAAQDVAPDRAAVALKALREFLRSRGHYPPPGRPR
jgi:hypothetical protein